MPMTARRLDAGPTTINFPNPTTSISYQQHVDNYLHSLSTNRFHQLSDNDALTLHKLTLPDGSIAFSIHKTTKQQNNILSCDTHVLNNKQLGQKNNPAQQVNNHLNKTQSPNTLYTDENMNNTVLKNSWKNVQSKHKFKEKSHKFATHSTYKKLGDITNLITLKKRETNLNRHPQKSSSSLLNEAQQLKRNNPPATMPSAALVTPSKSVINNDSPREDTYLDFLIGIQNIFDGAVISKLKKTQASDLYDSLLAYQLTPFDKRPSNFQPLTYIKKALTEAVDKNNAVIILFNDSIDIQNRENREDDRIRQYLPSDMALSKTFSLVSLRALSLVEAQLLLGRYYMEENIEADDSFLQEADRVELIVEIYDILHTIYCNNTNHSIVDALEDSNKAKKVQRKPNKNLRYLTTIQILALFLIQQKPPQIPKVMKPNPNVTILLLRQTKNRKLLSLMSI